MKPRQSPPPPSLLLLLLSLYTLQQYYQYYTNNPNNPNNAFSIFPITIFANAQSIQGYIYWDQNGNGQLEEVNWKNELENGIIDVLVEMRSCGGGGGGEVDKGACLKIKMNVDECVY